MCERQTALTPHPVRCAQVRDSRATVSKVKAIQGDIQLPGLGLSQSDRSKLLRNVDVIIHCAADIRLEPTIHETLQVTQGFSEFRGNFEFEFEFRGDAGAGG